MGARDAERQLDQGSGSAPHASPAPATLGKYELIATLGRGAMADVYLAVARGPMGFAKLVVVKRIHPAFGGQGDPSSLDAFLDEARIAARLDHANIVRTFEVGELDGVGIVATEYLEGQSLQRILHDRTRRRERLPPPMCARIVADALAGLQHAHDLNDFDGSPLPVLHRDLRPTNVFVTYDGRVVLLGFGLARAAASSPRAEAAVGKARTAYSAPEEALGRSLDGRADVFPMGVVLWELLTLQRLMPSESSAVSLHKLLNEPIPRVSRVLPNIDPQLDEIVARALERDVARRHSSAKAMRVALEAYIADAGAVTSGDVGMAISSMYEKLREEVRRRIEAEMVSETGPRTTVDLVRLDIESLERVEASEAGYGIASGMVVVKERRTAGVLPSPRPSGSMAAMPKLRPLRPPPADLLAAPRASTAPKEEAPQTPRRMVLAVILALVIVAVFAALWPILAPADRTPPRPH